MLSFGDVLKAGFFVLLGALLAGYFTKNVQQPQAKPGRYQIMAKSDPNYDIFDTATGRIYYWRGQDGLKDVVDPIGGK